MTSKTAAARPRAAALRERIGLCQWFHMEDRRQVEATIDALDRLGVRHLRTGISWANWHRPGGRAWYDWQMAALRESGLELLLCVWHTPPSISAAPQLGSTAAPPARVKDYADFLDVLIDRYGDTFRYVELWNEPNNPYKWNGALDPGYARYADLLAHAGNWVRQRGKVAVMGGMTLLDYDFIDAVRAHDALDYVDIVGIHAFPEMWEPFATDWDHPAHWHGWRHRVGELAARSGGRPIWVTETGLATYRKDTGARCREQLQAERLLEALEAPAPRVYWYTLFDLQASRLAVEEANGGPREEAEYHMGLIRTTSGYRIAGHEKPAFFALRDALRADELAVELAPAGVD